MLTFATLAQAVAVAAGDGWGHMDGWSGRWMWFWGTLMLASWVAVIAGAVWLLMRRPRQRGAPRIPCQGDRRGAVRQR